MKKAIILLIAIGLIIPGAYYAYDRAKALNISRCLGCLSMEPKATEFDSFWIEYPDDYKNSGLPEHPQWVINETQQSIVFLYFWGPSCIPCEEQWKNMKNEGLVQGEEKGGQITENYSYKLLTDT